MTLDRHVSLERVNELVLQLVLDRSLQVSPIELGGLDRQLWRRTQRALHNEDEFDRLTGMERLWCPTGKVLGDEERSNRHAGLEPHRSHGPAQIASLKRRLQERSSVPERSSQPLHETSRGCRGMGSPRQLRSEAGQGRNSGRAVHHR